MRSKLPERGQRPSRAPQRRESVGIAPAARARARANVASGRAENHAIIYNMVPQRRDRLLGNRTRARRTGAAARGPGLHARWSDPGTQSLIGRRTYTYLGAERKWCSIGRPSCHKARVGCQAAGLVVYRRYRQGDGRADPGGGGRSARMGDEGLRGGCAACASRGAGTAILLRGIIRATGEREQQREHWATAFLSVAAGQAPHGRAACQVHGGLGRTKPGLSVA